MTEGQEKTSSSEDIEAVKKYKLWVLRAEGNENIAGPPVADELSCQEDVFEMLKERSLNPQWITSTECLQRTFKKDELYILPAFRGEIYDHLVSLKCRVYGPLALMACLKRKERLPKMHTPVWSVTMRGAIVCFTGIDCDTRSHLTTLVKQMGGTVSKAYTTKVTQLVADSQDTESKKYVTAVDFSVPVMSERWVLAAWIAAQSFDERNFTDARLIDEYKLKIFTKCIITCSGVAPQDRPTFSQLIEANGGIYTGNMRKNHCTHLVTDLNSGEKYKIARKWGWDKIKTVRMLWITRSVEKGHRLPERLYETRLNSTMGCSTPRSSQLTQFQPSQNLEISAIQPSSVDITAGSGRLQQRQQQQQLHLLGTAGDAELLSSEVQQSRLTRSDAAPSEVNEASLNENIPWRMKLPERRTAADDPIVLFDLDSIRSGDFMRSCTVHLCGIAEGNSKKYRWLTNKCGACRIDRINFPDNTHIVVGPEKLNRKLIEQLKEKARNNVKVVTCEWLLDCAKAHAVLDAKDYLIFRQEPREYESLKGTSSGVMGRSFGYDPPRKKPKLKITQLGALFLGKTIGGASAEVDSSKENDGERSLSDESEDSGDTHLFSGLSFRIMVNDEEMYQRLFCYIDARGGTVKVNRKIWVNYMVCAVVDTLLNDKAKRFNCGNVVSSFWLEDCIQKGAVMNAEKHPLYRPIEITEDSQIFERCTVALSTLPAAEKEIYTDMLYKFGAHSVKNRLGRSEHGKQLITSTHVVTGAETDRTEIARRFQKPVLDPSWIIESIVQNQLQPVDSFIFRDQPYKNYTRKDRLWMHAAEQKISNTNIAVDISNTKEQQLSPVVREGPNRGREVLAPTRCESNSMQKNSAKCYEVPGSIPGQNADFPDRSIEHGENLETSHERGGCLAENNFAAGLDLREAYAYVNQMVTQDATVTSGGNESWTDSLVRRALGEAVVKTAKPSEVPWSASFRRLEECSRMQTRLSKRNADFMTLIASTQDSKKGKTTATTTETRSAESIAIVKKKKELAARLADLAAKRAEYALTVAARKQKEQEMKEKEAASAQRVQKSPPKRTPRKKVYEPPEQERIGWQESSPRPIVSQISNPFAPDSVIAHDDVPQHGYRVENDGGKAAEDDDNEPNPAVENPEEERGDVEIEARTSKTNEMKATNVRKEESATFVKRVCFTSTEGHDRDALMAMALELGSEVSTVFDETVTLLVCGQIVRNEKVLCSIVKGVPVVDVDYVLDSHKASKWLEIDKYEWGSEHSLTKHAFETQRFAAFALACRRWRMKIAKNPGKRAFDGWNAVFYCGRLRFADMKRIINFGGGKAQLRDDASSLREFTIALVDKTRYWNAKEISNLIENNIQCFGIDFLATYLTLEDGSDVDQYFHKDYVAALNPR